MPIERRGNREIREPQSALGEGAGFFAYFAVLSTKTLHFRQSSPTSVFSVCSCPDSLVAAGRAKPSRLCVESSFQVTPGQAQSNLVKPGQTISLTLTMRGKSMEAPVHQQLTHHPIKTRIETGQTQSNLVKPTESSVGRRCRAAQESGQRVRTTQRGTTRCAGSSALPGRRRILSCTHSIPPSRILLCFQPPVRHPPHPQDYATDRPPKQ
jgi:hypothetical protein